MQFGPSVGGIENAPRYGNTGGVGQAGIIGRIAAAGGVTVNAATGGDLSSLYEKHDRHQGCAGCGKTSPIDDSAEAILFIGVTGAKDSSGSTTKVANTGPTTGTTPTGSTTTTASLPGDPPDAKKPLTPEEHNRLVNTANNLDQSWRSLDDQYNEQQRIINKAAGGGSLTPGERKAVDDAGGIPGLEKVKGETANRRDATHKDAQNAQREAKNNDSYRYVQ
jgi:hypothetical protein